MSITIDSKDAGKFLRNLDAAARVKIRLAMLRGAQRGRSIMVRRTPVDTGATRAGWKVFQSNMATEAARLINDSPMVGVLENGARPHAVSDVGILAIQAWVHRHGYGEELRAATHERNVGERFLGGAGARKVPTVEAADHAIAMGIVWKLRHEGQEPTHFIRDALPDLRRAVAREVTIMMRELMRSPPRAE